MTRISDPTDEFLRRAVEAALAPTLGEHAPHIGVAADHGTVTLSGEIADAEQHDRVVAAVLGVEGVHSIADELTSHDSARVIDTDTELAAAAQRALQRCDGLERDTVLAEVRDHVLTLVGRVSSSSERLVAERTVLGLPGLVRVNNRITVESTS